MRVAIVTTQVPFIVGGAEYLARCLRDEMLSRGIAAEIVTLPFSWHPPERVLDGMVMSRLVDLSAVAGERIDRIVTLKFPAYFVQHSNKVAWLLHQHRQAYELFDTPYSDLSPSEIGRSVAAEVRRWDGVYLPEHKAIHTISKTVTDRLKRFNNIDSNVLYPPPPENDRLRAGEYGNFVLYPGRFDQMKRQHLIVEAMARAPEGLILVLCGPNFGEYGEQLQAKIRGLKRDNVEVLGEIDVERKLDLYANCLAVYNGVLGEDYGYVTLEAYRCAKPVICHPDAGGPLEFVVDGENGFVVEPDPEAVSAALFRLWENRNLAARMGAAGADMLARRDVSWTTVLERLI